MLTIRKEQMEVLSRYMLKQFEDRMVVHLRNTFPDKTKDMPETNLHNLIQTGIEQSGQYDVELEYDVRRYLEFMMIYGSDFDMNPKTAWANEILHNKNMDGTFKMDLIDEHEMTLLMEQP